jgi:hypothetical protein
MAEPANSTPPTGSLKPPELPAVQLWHPKKPQRKLAPWHWVVLALGILIVAPCTAIGAYTSASWAFSDPPSVVRLATVKATPAKTHRTQPTRPAYNLAGYQAAISGPEERAFSAALNQFRADSKHYKFQALSTDSLSLSEAAHTWLSVLKATNPPPSYQAAKLDYLMAATLANRAAAKTQSGIATSSLTALAQGQSLAAQARAALSRAAESAPKGS